MTQSVITISTVNWYSCEYMDHLFSNLLNKAEHKERLFFLIVDNTNGQDKSLPHLSEKYNAKTINNRPEKLKGSYAHASGLNLLTNQINTEYALIVDPDIHVFKDRWDTYLLEITKKENLAAIGSTYPKWQFGKYHNFPNPVFCFFNTERFRELKSDWTPFESNLVLKIWDFLRRNVLRIGFVINRRTFENSELVRKLWPKLEKLIGTCSKDTGWKIARNALSHQVKSIVFDAVLYSCFSKDSKYHTIAKEFELYCRDNEPILAHKYSSCSPLWKTRKGSDLNYWNKSLLRK